MKKKLLGLTLAAVLAMSALTACGAKESADSAEVAVEETAEAAEDAVAEDAEVTEDAEEIAWYTVDEAKAICDKEFFERELDLIVMKATYENLINKSKKIVEYINIVKIALRKDFSI